MSYYSPIEGAFQIAAFLVISAIGTMVCLLRSKNSKTRNEPDDSGRVVWIALGLELSLAFCFAIPVFKAGGWSEGAVFCVVEALEVFVCSAVGIGIGVSLLYLGRVRLGDE